MTSKNLPPTRKARAYDALSQAIVRLRVIDDEDVFTGFFVTKRGHLLTVHHGVKNHVFMGDSDLTLEVTFHDLTTSQISAEYSVDLADPGQDWCILRLEYSPRIVLPISSFDRDHVTEEILAPGFGGGKHMRDHGGRISSDINIHGTFEIFSANSGGGHSGAPIYNIRRSAVVGISRAQWMDGGKLIGEAIPLNVLIKKCDRIFSDSEEIEQDWSIIVDKYQEIAIPRHQEPQGEPTYLIKRKEMIAIAEQHLAYSNKLFIVGDSGAGKTVFAAQLFRPYRLQKHLFYLDFDDKEHRDVNESYGMLCSFLWQQGIPGPARTWERIGGATQAKIYLNSDFKQLRYEINRAIERLEKTHPRCYVIENLHRLSGSPSEQSQEELRNLIKLISKTRAMLLLTSRSHPIPNFKLSIQILRLKDPSIGDIQDYFGLRGFPVDASRLKRHFADFVDFMLLTEVGEQVEKLIEVHPDATPEDIMLDIEGKPNDFFEKGEYISHYAPEERSILEAFCILGRAAPKDLLAEVSQVSNFNQTFQRLTKNSAITPIDQQLYTLHKRRMAAVLNDDSHASKRSSAHLRAANWYFVHQEYLFSAIHRHLGGATSEALTVLVENIETIVGKGKHKSLKDFIEDLERDEHSWQKKDKAFLDIAQGQLFNIRGNFQEAIISYRAAINLLSPHRSSYFLCVGFSRIGKRNPSPTQTTLCTVTNLLADSLRLISNYDEARKTYQNAFRMSKGADSQQLKQENLRALLGMAKMARLECDYKDAHRKYEVTLATSRELRDVKKTIEAYFGIGEVLRLQSKLDTSLGAYKSSHNLASEKSHLERTAYTHWGIGEIYRLKGEISAAKKEHHRGREICIEVGDRRSEGWAILGIAETLRADREYLEARNLFRQAQKIFIETQSETEYSHSLFGEAESIRLLKHETSELYLQAETRYKKRKLNHCLLQLHIGRGLSLLGNNETHQQGIKELTKALRLALRHKLPAEVKRVQEILQNPTPHNPNPLNFP